MTWSFRFAPLLLLVAFAVPARAQDEGFELLDRGRLVAYHGDTPIATERFLYERSADSLVIIAHADRRKRAPDGTDKPYKKSMTLVARAEDFGLIRYTSTESFYQHVISRNISPNDTMLVIFMEVDGRGVGSSIDRPPGRFFAVDQGLFSLFDVVARNVHGRLFGPRPLQLVVLGEDSKAVEATVSPAGHDTVGWGGRRVITERVVLADSSGTFTLWLSPEGHLLRLENEKLGLVVMREPPEAPAPARRRRSANR